MLVGGGALKIYFYVGEGGGGVRLRGGAAVEAGWVMDCFVLQWVMLLSTYV